MIPKKRADHIMIGVFKGVADVVFDDVEFVEWGVQC